MVVLSQYPGALDAYSRRTDLVDLVMAADPNELQAAVENIESTLGINPQGGAPTVVARLDRIGSSDGYTITPQTALLVNGGYPTGATIDSSGNLQAVGNGTFGYAGIPVKLKVFGQAEIGTAGTTASGSEAVAIGSDCLATGNHSFAVGDQSHAHGEGSVAMGDRCSADVDYTHAIGRRAICSHAGTFVWADGVDADFASTDINQFSIRAGNGVRIINASAPAVLNNEGIHIETSGSSTMNIGVNIATNGADAKGIYITATGTSGGESTGIYSQAVGTGLNNYGAILTATNGTTNYGLWVSGLDWGIYSAGGNNYFAGRVGIGVSTPLLGQLNVATSGTSYGADITQSKTSGFNRALNLTTNGVGASGAYGAVATVSGGSVVNEGFLATVTGTAPSNVGFYSDVSGGTINYDLYCNQTTSFIKFPYRTTIPTAAADNGSTAVVYTNGVAQLYVRANSAWQNFGTEEAEGYINIVKNSIFEKMSGAIPNDWTSTTGGTGGTGARAANTMNTRGQYMASFSKAAGVGYVEWYQDVDTSTIKRYIPWTGTRRFYVKAKVQSSVVGQGILQVYNGLTLLVSIANTGTGVETLEAFADVPSTSTLLRVVIAAGDNSTSIAATVKFSEVMFYEGAKQKQWTPNPVDDAGYYV